MLLPRGRGDGAGLPGSGGNVKDGAAAILGDRYRDRPLDAPAMDPARRAVEFILSQREPYPAIVLDSPPRAASGGTKLEVECRGERRAAEVVSRPFWKKGTARKGG